MRELRVEDALLYLDQVKMEFGDRPHIYNEFLDIMKTFKTQQLDTPGVIRRVSSLFQGNRRLVLGFNTFLPEGYKIEMPVDGEGPPVAVYRHNGQTSVTLLGPATSHSQPGMPGQVGSSSGPAPAAHAQTSMMGQQQAARGSAMMRDIPMAQAPMRQGQPGTPAPQQPVSAVMKMDHGGSGDPYRMQAQQQPMQMQQASQRPQASQQQMMGADGGAMGRQMSGDQQAHINGQQQQIPTRQPPQPPQPSPPQMQSVQHVAPAQQPQQQQQPGAAQAPVEFDHAINYVTTIKKRFAAEPDIYKKFLEILHTYQKEQRGIKEVLDEVSVLFADHPDLLKEFTYFLPDAVQAQAKAQLDAVAKESEARKRAVSSQQAIMKTAQGMQRQAHGLGRPQGALPGGVIPRAGAHIYSPSQTPFGATQGRSDEREREICRSSIYGSVLFAPVRPPRRNELTPAQAATKNGRPQMIPEPPVQPTAAEAAFFERAKLHLHRKELMPDKPPNSRRHNPYTEFLKCLHLYGAGILNKEELVLLLRGLFMQGHAPKSGSNAGGGASNPAVANDAQELLREFEEILIGRGPYADQENALKDKSKYGAVPRREYDYSHCEHPTPSYRSIPSDYPQSLFFSHSGQTESDAAVLNNSLLCVVPQRSSKQRYMLSPEEYDGVRARRNVHEEAMFKVEDERFEVDMAIDRNVTAMRQIEPMAEEVTRLRDIEEKEGQPIGRMTYRLRSRALHSSHINAVARLYGDKGDEIIQHLMRNPVAVLPIVYRRLRQKDGEWRRFKSEMSPEWNAVYEANYEGSLDVLCSSFKKELERVVSHERLLEDVKRTRHLVKHPRKNTGFSAISWANPEYFLSCPLPEEVLYQPHVLVPMKETDFPHKDVFQLVSRRALNGMIKSGADRERVARIWAEFVSPWFGYSSYWIIDELRESYKGDDSTCTVKYSPGQRVRTSYGDGVIHSKIAGSRNAGMRYKVKLGYGMGYIRPSNIIHILPATESSNRMVRRKGVMEQASLLEESEEGVHKRCKMMFATERVYLFMRIYCFLAFVMSNTQSFLLVNAREGKKEESQAANGIGSAFEKDKTGAETEASKATQDYPGLVVSLKKLISGDIDIQAFESFCRKTAKDKVYQLVALPRLIDRCAEALVKVAKEDKVLSLFDLAQLKIMDPERLRVLSYSETSDASYRIQFDPIEEFQYFCYLAPGEQVLLAPGDDSDDEMEAVDEEDGEEEEEDATMDEEVGQEAEEEDVESEVDDAESDMPSAKRPKLK